MIPDIINGLFELLGGLFVLNHCRSVLRDKAVAGVSIISTIFFTSWGVWNLYYYPSLNQWASFVGGLFIVAANCFWIALMLKFRKRKFVYGEPYDEQELLNTSITMQCNKPMKSLPYAQRAN